VQGGGMSTTEATVQGGGMSTTEATVQGGGMSTIAKSELDCEMSTTRTAAQGNGLNTTMATVLVSGMTTMLMPVPATATSPEDAMIPAEIIVRARDFVKAVQAINMIMIT
ncbi:MAG: hypothetical protein FWH55_11475, partial [Oscillospiraceae bacterium]|nr:hypothetical protein [Oscillospiraceae bacterium]